MGRWIFNRYIFGAIMEEILIIPMRKEENEALFNLLNRYEQVEKNTIHPYIKKIAKQRQKSTMDLLGFREKERC